MRKLVVIFLVLAAAQVLAQMPGPDPTLPVPVIGVPPELRDFLQLSREQVDSINRQNIEFYRFWLQRQRRIAQVRQEIVVWTNASPLDPMALGLRYAEIEALHRELRDEEKRTEQRVLAVLNDPQKARLRVLDEALKLQPRVNEAICINLIPEPVGPNQPQPVGPEFGIRGCPGIGVIRALPLPDPRPVLPGLDTPGDQ